MGAHVGLQYNGCKWKGGVLRVEKAKEHYTNRLSREWAEAEVAKAKAMETQLQPDLITAGKLGDKSSRGSAAREIPFLLTEPLKIPVPFSKKVCCAFCPPLCGKINYSHTLGLSVICLYTNTRGSLFSAFCASEPRAGTMTF